MGRRVTRYVAVGKRRVNRTRKRPGDGATRGHGEGTLRVPPFSSSPCRRLSRHRRLLARRNLPGQESAGLIPAVLGGGLVVGRVLGPSPAVVGAGIGVDL